MRRSFIMLWLLAVCAILAGVFCMAAAPWAFKHYDKQLLDGAVSFDITPQVVWVKPWTAPLCASGWTEGGSLIIPAASTTPSAGGWADSVLTIPPGEWYPIRTNGAPLKRLYLRTKNAYSTWDSNATAVSLEVD